MRMKTILATIIAVLMGLPVLTGCAAAEEAGQSAQLVETPSFALDASVMEDPEGFLVLANTASKLAADFVPPDLVKISVRRTTDAAIQMRKPVSEALTAMFAAADADGIKLYAHSGYRSYHTQDVMYTNRLKSLGYDDKAVQQPGASDHQTGLGIDVISKAWIGSKLNYRFFDTPEGQWLDAHSREFGFIIRYPKDKTDVTGIMYEPWHLRYVGVEAAEYIMGNGLTLEEFWQQWEASQAGGVFAFDEEEGKTQEEGAEGGARAVGGGTDGAPAVLITEDTLTFEP